MKRESDRRHRRHLLVVNVLIAKCDAAHPHHGLARRLFDEANEGAGWACCPMTENGLIRIMSARSYPGGAVSLPVLVRVLSALKSSNHRFVADDVSLTDDARFDFGHFQGHSQLTDAYLLALAVKHRLRFATFDKRINSAIITGGARVLEVISLN